LAGKLKVVFSTEAGILFPGFFPLFPFSPFPIIPSFHHSIIPSFHYSIIPSFHHSILLLFILFLPVTNKKLNLLLWNK